MNVLDLFSGIGGFSLGLERAGMRTVAFCEIEPYCQAVLRRHWPAVPIYGDIRELSAQHLTAAGISVDVIAGGFPCQDISLAGKGAGIDGERSGLWSEYARLIGELRPSYAIVENVTALLDRGLERVLRDLAALRYDAEWECVSANAIGAPHMRDRIWITAYPDTNSLRPQRLRPAASRAWPQQQFERLLQDQIRLSLPTGKSGGVADGVPNRSHRLKGLGNAVVPQIPEIIGRAIMRAEA
jgi:DNA (cytosine-5)-methyltransferase 1